MQYMLLIYGDESQQTEPSSPEEAMAQIEPWFAYTRELREAGVMLAGDALQPIATATSVRVRNGDAMTTDGPFAETKEQLGGYYLLECDNLDEALKWAAKCPGALYGTIEVRPVMELPSEG